MNEFFDRFLDLAIAIQQIPAPTFQEGQRAKLMRDQFVKEELLEVETDAVGNVYGRIPGISRAFPLVVSAHMDTVFPIGTDLKVVRQSERIIGPGIGDNATGLAALIGLIWLLRERQIYLPGDLWLVANVAEEGLGNLGGMRAVVERFGKMTKAYLVLEGTSLGQIYHRALSVQRYHISVQTTGGHSWIDYGQPSAVHILSALSTQVAALPLPSEPRTTLNVGRISGGTSVNTIAAEAFLELDLRSEDEATLAALVLRIEELVQSMNQPGARVNMEVVGQRPAGEIPADSRLVQLATDCLRQQGLEPNLAIGSTDANLPLSQGLPALCLGVTTGGGAHTSNEFIHTQPVRQGIEQLVGFVSGVWK